MDQVGHRYFQICPNIRCMHSFIEIIITLLVQVRGTSKIGHKVLCNFTLVKIESASNHVFLVLSADTHCNELSHILKMQSTYMYML